MPPPLRIPKAAPGALPPVIGENGESLSSPSKNSLPIRQKPQVDPISGTVWGLLILAAIFVDVGQWGVDLLNAIPGLGVIINRYIDVVVGFLLLIYCLMNGLTTVKQIASLIGAFGLEFIGVGDILPLWTADVILIMLWHKAEIKVAKIPAGNLALRSRYARRAAGKLPFVRKKAPPIIGSSGLPQARPGEKPPVIGKTGSPQASPSDVPPVTGMAGEGLPKSGQAARNPTQLNTTTSSSGSPGRVMSVSGSPQAAENPEESRKKSIEKMEREAFRRRLIGENKEAEIYEKNARILKGSHERVNPGNPKHVVDLRRAAKK